MEDKGIEQQSLKKTKYAEYIRDFTAIGNPFLLLLVALGTLSSHPKFETYFLILLAGFFLNEILCSAIKYFWHKPIFSSFPLTHLTPPCVNAN